MTSCIYFIQAQPDGPIKIGTTRSDPRRRMQEIQVGCPWPVAMIGAIEGTAAHEKQFHRRLAEFRTSGEWFAPHPTVLATVSDSIRSGSPIEFTKEWEPKYDHPLCIWLARNRIRAFDFAQRVGVTPPAITGMFRDGTWIGRDLARKIYDATNGEVTPTDFMLWEPASNKAAAA